MAIHRLERATDPHTVGSTATALTSYRSFIESGRSPLYPNLALFECCPGCSQNDIRFVRDDLEEAIAALPLGPRRELRRLVNTLDRLYRDRTLPNPLFPTDAPWADLGWWHRRLDTGRQG